MSKLPVYNVWKDEYISRIIDLIKTIRAETRPVEGHSDPGAIEDCWESLEEMMILMTGQLATPRNGPVEMIEFKAHGDGTFFFRLTHNIHAIDQLSPYPHTYIDWRKLILDAINRKIVNSPGFLADKPKAHG